MPYEGLLDCYSVERPETTGYSVPGRALIIGSDHNGAQVPAAAVVILQVKEYQVDRRAFRLVHRCNQ